MMTFSFFNIKPAKYARLADQEDGQLDDSKTTNPAMVNFRLARDSNAVWKVLTFVLAALAGYLFTQSFQINKYGAFDRGYHSDMGKRNLVG
jgi:hypothetical protein